MERKGGAATIMLLLVTVLGVSFLPRRGAESSPASSAGKAQTGVGAKKPSSEPEKARLTASAACQEIARRLQRFTSGSTAMPESCFPDVDPSAAKAASALSALVPAGTPFEYSQESNPAVARGTRPGTFNSRVHFAVAIVPNPVQTHLPLFFDRAVEAIQQAAQDENYAYDSSWFPWTQRQTSYESMSDEEKAESQETEQQRQPGVIIFRRGLNSETVEKLYQCELLLDNTTGPCATPPGGSSPGDPYGTALVVFVIGEQPTGGISDPQFDRALQWMQILQPDHSQNLLRILGPTFSGSLPSLARKLDNATLKQFGQGVDIYSGSVSSEVSVHWFELFLKTRQEELAKQGLPRQLTFRTFSEGDSLMTDRFLCYLQGAGYNLSRVAILSEDETAFGKAPAPPTAPKSPGGAKNDPGQPPNREQSSPRCGGQNADGAGSPTYLYYPRDIATLRSAYERQSIFTAGKQSNSSAPSTTLRTDLSEPVSVEHDTVRTYAGQLTPLAQESVLFGITNMLENKRIEFVILRSSNTLDQLFLSEFLRRSYPGARIVLDGADLLFRKGMEGASLRGVMLLSTYPLLTWTQDAAPLIRGQRARSYRIFPQDFAEGTYIAARELFEPPANATDPSEERSSIAIADYAPPRAARDMVTAEDKDPTARIHEADNRRPATWISVVGHRQFWAVAVLNSNTQDENGPAIALADAQGGKTALDKSLLKPENPTERDKSGPSAKGFAGWMAKLKGWWHGGGIVRSPGELTALLILCLALAGWHLYCCAQGSIVGAPRARAYFAPIPRVQHVVLISLGSVVIGALGMTLAFSTGLFALVLTPTWYFTIAGCVTAIVICGYLGCRENCKLPVVAGDDLETREVLPFIERWRRLVPGYWVFVLTVLSLLRYLFLTDRLTDANRLPAYWRNVHLRSGVSALLPQVLLILGMYAWFWFTLRGLSMFGDDRPVLPPLGALPTLDDPNPKPNSSGKIPLFRMFSQEHAGKTIETSALPLDASYAWTLVAFLAGVVPVVWIALGEANLRTLGDRSFGAMIFGYVCLCVAVILADTLQLLRTWSNLRQLLLYLDRLRLRRTLSCFKGLTWESVWTMSANVLEERYRLISRQFESMSNLRNLLREWVPASADTGHKDKAAQKLDALQKVREKFAAWYVTLTPKEQDITPLEEMQRELSATAGVVLSEIILPAWQKETHSLILEPVPAGEKAEAAKKEDKAAGQNSESSGKSAPGGPSSAEVVRAAEEFFVLPYLGFIQNILGRVRSIVMGILALFVAATLGLSSYPFDPLPVIGAIFLILFLLVGASIIFVYAEMHRDATLSHITNTRPGELGLDFWLRIVTFGIGPLIGLLTTLFPSMTDFVVSFLQPGAQAMK